DDAKTIRFGLQLSGRGRAWIDDVRFEPVGTDVPVTTKPASPGYRVGYLAASLLHPDMLADPRSRTVIRVSVVLAAALTLIGWIVATARPDRSLPDRLAGTRLMMR